MPFRTPSLLRAFPSRGGAAWLVIAVLIGLPASTVHAREAPAPAWIQFLGWASDGQQLAWRQGDAGTANVPGQPCLVATVDADGNLGDPAPLNDKVKETLAMLRIKAPPPIAAEQVTPQDVLLRSTRGRLYAVVARSGQIAVLAKRGKGYDPVAKHPVRGKLGPLEAVGFEDRAHKNLAIVTHFGTGRRRMAKLLIVPLLPVSPPTQPEASLPADPTAAAP